MQGTNGGVMEGAQEIGAGDWNARCEEFGV